MMKGACSIPNSTGNLPKFWGDPVELAKRKETIAIAAQSAYTVIWDGIIDLSRVVMRSGT